MRHIRLELLPCLIAALASCSDLNPKNPTESTSAQDGTKKESLPVSTQPKTADTKTPANEPSPPIEVPKTKVSPDAADTAKSTPQERVRACQTPAEVNIQLWNHNKSSQYSDYAEHELMVTSTGIIKPGLVDRICVHTVIDNKIHLFDRAPIDSESNRLKLGSKLAIANGSASYYETQLICNSLTLLGKKWRAPHSSVAPELIVSTEFKTNHASESDIVVSNYLNMASDIFWTANRTATNLNIRGAVVLGEDPNRDERLMRQVICIINSDE